MGPNLYSQTPGALHMGGGYANPFAAQEAFLGNIYGPSARGDSFARFGAGLPAHALSLGTAASIAHGIGFGGRMTGAVGNTLGMGAMSMGPQILAAAAMQYAGGQMARGQEQNKISQNLSQRVFGERNVGGRMGMGASRDAIAGFSGAFRELANSSEMLTNDRELKNVLEKFSDMKLLDTSKNLSQMGERVKKMSKTLREISMDLGTTLEGALPDFQRHAQMGFMDPDQMRQSIRTNRALRGVGISMDDSTIQSFEMAQAATNFAMGGDKRIGALGAQRTLGNLSVATSMGLLSDRDLMSATGKRGADGVADLAQQSMQASSAFMQSANGRLLAAALGEVGEDGKFTGGIDSEIKRKLKAMSMEDISKEANRKLSSEGGTASFERRMRAGMGANMGASLDMSEFSSALDKVFDNEDEMAIVLQQLTGMRGQTIDVLMKMQKDGDQIVKETKRRTQELSQRNRLNSVVQREFTLSGKLDKAYRDYISEPIGQPIQTVGSEVGAAFGKYGDNFGDQMMANGIVTGFARATVGLGMNENQAEQSYADRTSDMGRAINDMFGEGAGETTTKGLTLGGGLRTAGMLAAGAATTNPFLIAASGASFMDNIAAHQRGGKKVSIFGDKDEHMRRILAASGDLQERESEIGLNSTTFGHSDKGFLQAFQGEGMKVDYTDEEKKALMRGVMAAFEQGNDIENMTEEFAKAAFEGTGAFSDTVGMEQRERMEARGGQYGAMKQLANDKSLTEGQRKMVRKVLQRQETQLRTKVTLDSEENSVANLKSANTTLAGLFDFGTDGLEEEFFSSTIDHVENDYLFSLRKGGEISKLQSYMEVLSDEKKIRQLNSHPNFGPDISAKDAVKIAKDVFSVDINEEEGEKAKAMFNMLFKRITDDSVAKFAERMKPMAQKAVETIKKKKRAEANNRGLSLMKDLDRSKMDGGARSKLRQSFVAAFEGEKGGGVGLFKAVHRMEQEDIDSVEGEMGRVLQRVRDMGTDEESIKKILADKNVDAKLYEGKSLDELKELAVQAELVGSAPVTSNTQQGQVIANLSPGENAKILADLSNNVSSNMEVMTSSAMRYQHATTEEIKKLKSKTGG